MSMNFDETMDRWNRLTGFDVDKSRLNLHDWHIRDINESIADIRRIENGDLIALVGSKENLPDLLHHWYPRNDKPYVGNHILNRIDPFDIMDNPWSKCSLGVIIYLSKRGWKQLQLPSINP